MGETCGICGGDGRIGNAFGLTTTCPGCHGSGQRSETTGMRDVTKTKPARPPIRPKQTWPQSFEGGQLATEVQNSTACSPETKARLIREIMEYEGSHGACTGTFIKKVRKQIRPPR